MKKKTIYSVFGVLILSAISIFFLVQFTEKPNEKKNGFTRTFIPYKLSLLNQTKILTPLNKICGYNDHNIYFSTIDPKWLIRINSSLDKIDTIAFPIPLNRETIKTYSTYIDSPMVFFHANNIPAIIYSRLHDTTFYAIKPATSIFSKSVPISYHSTIIRALDSSQKKQLFKKINNDNGDVVLEAEIIENQRDGGFSTDGLLKYDSFLNRLIFVQYYQNRFYCLDTNLNLIYSAKTIDTTNSNMLEIKHISFNGENKLMPATPRKIINTEGCVDNGVLYLLSGLKADNESLGAFKKESAIDIYKIDDGKYVGSFYIPLANNEKIKSLLIKGNTAIVLYQTHIRKFLINQLP